MITQITDCTSAEEILQRCAPLIEEINQHPIYQSIRTLNNLRIFTEHHVFAVWDFICLLKELHRCIVCIQAPWFPPKDAYCAHLISRILIEEEGDRTEDQQQYLSHFELYLSTMKQISADVQPVQTFLSLLRTGCNVKRALHELALPLSVQQFVTTTFSFFSDKPHVIAAVFVYGREAITPNLFTPLMQRLRQTLSIEDQSRVSILRYYLRRHIELDHTDHLPQALQMISRLAGDDSKKWDEIAIAAQQALEARLDFLAGIHTAILAK